jgi:hypothetical protein
LGELNEEVDTISKDLEDKFYSLKLHNSALYSPTTRIDWGFQGSPAVQMARNLQESPFIRMAREFQDSIAAQMTREFQDSTAAQMAREFPDSTAAQMAREFQGSTVAQMAREFQGSTVAQIAREFQGSTVAQMAREFQGSTVAQMAREFQGSTVAQIAREFQGSTVAQMAREFQDSSVTRGLRGLEFSSLLDALPRITGLPFDPALVNQAVAISQYTGYRQQAEHEIASEELTAVEEELNRLGQGSLDFSSLSESGRRTLVWLFYWVVLPFLVNIAASMALERFSEKAAISESVTTPNEAKRLARCSSELEKEIFTGCRVVIGDALRLRREPSMKAEVMTNLPLGKLIVVLDSSERAWLLVEVDMEGDRIEGWVSRRYTTKFK